MIPLSQALQLLRLLGMSIWPIFQADPGFEPLSLHSFQHCRALVLPLCHSSWALNFIFKGWKYTMFFKLQFQIHLKCVSLRNRRTPDKFTLFAWWQWQQEAQPTTSDLPQSWSRGVGQAGPQAAVWAGWGEGFSPLAAAGRARGHACSCLLMSSGEHVHMSANARLLRKELSLCLCWTGCSFTEWGNQYTFFLKQIVLFK